MSRSIPPLQLDPADAAAAPPFLQTLAGAYQVGGVIGVGTYGEVRYAVSVVTGDRVAIKIVDLARFSRETAGLMRKEIAILRMLGNHPHCIRIIEVHENVTFAGKWCESCACTRFKRRTEEKEQAEAAAAGGAAGPSPARPAHPTKRPPLVSTSPCATCSHSAAEHSGVNYQHDTSFRAHHSHGGPAQEEEDDEDDLGETRQVMLIVQELGSGGELFSLLAHSGPLPEDVARLYFQQLISGMEHLHSLNVTHRDIKPENLVLNEHFQLKIADFGLASLGTPVHPHDVHNTTLSHPPPAGGPGDTAQHTSGLPDVRHYSGVGSQPYAAPECYYIRELYGGRGYRGAPCDVWSAAVCLFVMLVGRPPFVRPLAKTYGAHMRRCRHFVNILSGTGLDMLHPHAKDLLQKLLKIAPHERLTIPQMKLHPWMLGPVPSNEELVKIMNERSMISWKHSANGHEMTHVLSNMRSSKVEPPSNQATPHFGPQSPSGSPALEPHTALNSPSFSALASSVPPSPFAAAHTYAYHSGQRAASPDSQQLHHRYSTVSPASFVAQGPSAFLSPSAAHHSSGGAGGLAFLPPPNLSQTVQAARGHSAATATAAESVESAAAPVIIASSINPAAASVLRPHATPAILSVALLQMNLNTAPPPAPVPVQPPAPIDAFKLSESHDEIPPPLPLPSTPVSPPSSAAAVESKQEEHARKKLAALAAQVESAQRQSDLEKKRAEKKRAAARAITPLKRSFTHTRQSTSPPHAQMHAHDGHASGGDDSPTSTGASAKHLSLSTSHSYPPRVSYASFTSSLDFSTLLSLIQSRLETRSGTRFHAVPPRGKLQGTLVQMPSGVAQHPPSHAHAHPHPPKKTGSAKSPQSTSPQHSPRGGSGAGAASPAHAPHVSLSSSLSTVETDEESLLHVVTSWHGAHIVALISIRTIRQTPQAVANTGASEAAGPGAAASVHPGAGVAADPAALVSRVPKGRLVIAEKIRAADPRAFQAWFESIAAGLREE